MLPAALAAAQGLGQAAPSALTPPPLAPAALQAPPPPAALAAAQGPGNTPALETTPEQEESDDDEGLQYGPQPVYRRMGLPARVIVQREGDVYVLSRTAANEAIEAVLWFRRQALQWHSLDPTAILPYHVHSEAFGRFKKWFQNSNLAERAWQSSKKWQGKSHAYGSQISGGTPSRSAGEWCYARPLRQALSRSAGGWQGHGKNVARTWQERGKVYGRPLAE